MSRERRDNRETGEVEGRRLKVGVQSSEHFSLQTISPVPLFQPVSRGYSVGGTDSSQTSTLCRSRHIVSYGMAVVFPIYPHVSRDASRHGS